MNSMKILGEQYMQNAEAIKSYLHELKVKLKTTRGQEAFTLEKRINELDKEQYDLTLMGYKLMNYYQN